MDPDDVEVLAHRVAERFASSDVAALRDVWHPEISVASMSGAVVRGVDAVAALVQQLHDEGVSMEPQAIQVDGHDAIVSGEIVMAGRRTPATWVWTFRDGLLWRSTTMVREPPSTNGHVAPVRA